MTEADLFAYGAAAITLIVATALIVAHLALRMTRGRHRKR